MRPIKSKIEFGSKLGVSLDNGFAQIDVKFHKVVVGNLFYLVGFKFNIFK
jgi:hypothetical protein